MEEHIKELRKIVEDHSDEIINIKLFNIDTDKVYLEQIHFPKNKETFFIVRYKYQIYAIHAVIELANVGKIEYMLCEMLHNK